MKMPSSVYLDSDIWVAKGIPNLLGRIPWIACMHVDRRRLLTSNSEVK